MVWLLSKGDPLQSSKPKTTQIKIPQTLIDGSTKLFEVKILAWNESDPPVRETEGLEQVCVLNIDLTGLPREVLRSTESKEGDSLEMVGCQVEIKIEGSMLEFRVLVGKWVCCKALARDA